MLGEREFLFSEHGVSAWEDEKCPGGGWQLQLYNNVNYFVPLNSTLKSDENGKYIYFTTIKKVVKTLHLVTVKSNLHLIQ